LRGKAIIERRPDSAYSIQTDYNEGMAVEKNVTREPETAPPAKPVGSDAPMNGHAPKVRYASDEEFRKAQRKTSATHADLFRRLAQ